MLQNHLSYTTVYTELHYYAAEQEQSLALHIFTFVWYLNMNNATVAATVLVACCLNMPGTFKLLSWNFWKMLFKKNIYF